MCFFSFSSFLIKIKEAVPPQFGKIAKMKPGNKSIIKHYKRNSSKHYIYLYYLVLKSSQSQVSGNSSLIFSVLSSCVSSATFTGGDVDVEALVVVDAGVGAFRGVSISP